MNEQAELDFNRKRYPDSPGYQRGSRTSYEAAVSVLDTAPSKRETVFEAIKARQGATCDELVAILHMPVQTVTPRLRELCLKGRIADSGFKRPTQTGRLAVVWVVT